MAKDKELEVIGRWRKACVRHFYWAATSTHSGNGEVKWAKFESFFSHITNVHKDLPNKIFNRCAHSDIIKPRVWLTKGKGIKLVNHILIHQKFNKPVGCFYGRIFSPGENERCSLFNQNGQGCQTGIIYGPD